MADWGGLGEAITGRVVEPGSPEYDAVRKPGLARYQDSKPQAVVLCETPPDVAAALRLAHKEGVSPAVRAGGHCFAGSSSGDGVVIDVSPMNNVSVVGGVATVGAGTRLGPLADALAEVGLTVPAGCGETVGIAGLTLGGGLGPLGRLHGLTCDQLLAAQVVLADGRVVECSDDDHPELFWALRGAGAANFGVVTELVLRTVPAPAVTAFHLTFASLDAVAAIGAWQQWAPSAPPDLDATLRLAVHPGGPLVLNLIGAMVAGEGRTTEMLDGFIERACASPEFETIRSRPYNEAKRFLSGLGTVDSSVDGALYSKSEFFRRSLPPEALSSLIENLSPTGEADPEFAREVDFTAWGGAYNRPAPDATAFVHRDESFLVEHLVMVDPRSSTEAQRAGRRWLGRSWEATHPWGTGGVYPNFPDPDLPEPAEAYYGANRERLEQIKQAYDPGGLFALGALGPGPRIA